MKQIKYCTACGVDNIHIKKSQLCRKCYMKQYMAKRRPHRKKKVLTKQERKSIIIKNIIENHGIEFIKDLKKVKTQHFYTLQTLAEKYDISRERVRQLFNKIYEKPFTPYMKKKMKERKESENLVCTHDPRRKVAEYTNKKSPAYIGALAEKLFLQKCEEYGFEVSIPCKQTFDIIVNNYIIDVKSSASKSITSKKYNKFYYHAKLTAKQRKKCDFFAWYIIEQDCFYIIPNKEKGKEFNKAKTLFIPEVISNYKSAKNWHIPYNNAFHLLKRPSSN